MTQQRFKIQFSKNKGTVISPSELKDIYFHGVPVTDQSGNPMPEHVIQSYIDSAVREVQLYLNLLLVKQTYKETQNFVLHDFREWGALPTTYPVNKPLSLTGYINTTKQAEYPSTWLSSKKAPNSLYDRSINLIPNTGTVGTNSVVYHGITPHLGFNSSKHIPNYWEICYITGFDKTPSDILNVVGKLAAINIFHILGDLILGAGIASISLGIDGLSQSTSTTSSATNAGYGARIQGYEKDLKTALPTLKQAYDGFQITSM